VIRVIQDAGVGNDTETPRDVDRRNEKEAFE
jgi:hypothetical protein